MQKHYLIQLIFLCFGLVATSQVSTSENYVLKRSYQTALSTPLTTTGTTSAIETVTYYDGLGRPKQQVAIRASNDRQDILTHIGYDAYGRQDKEWLPIENTSTSYGSFRTGDQGSATNTFYRNKYPSDISSTVSNRNAYSAKLFEASPLNRVLKQGAPGDAWRLNNQDDKGLITFSYETNTSSDNVKLYRVTFTSGNTASPVLAQGTNYDNGELYKTVTKDENHDGGTSKNHTTEEFTDKQGRVVLKRTYGDSDSNGDGIIGTGESGIKHDTYYVYDDFGNLTYVLPPKIDATTNNLTTVQSRLNELGYQYKYDHRNRLIEKKIPGKGWEVIVYNKLDQPIMTQDALQAGKSPKEWLFTKYDAFGRVTYTGLFKSNLTRAQHQANADAEADQYENTQSTALTYGGGSFYYTDNAYPDLSSNSSNVTLYTVNYYDDYRFYGTSLPSTVYSVAVQNYNNAASTKIKTKGLATGSKVRVLTTNDWITTVTGYDKKGKMIYSKSDNPYLQTTDELKTKLDFVGKVVETTSVHTKTGQSTITTIDKYTYDHMGRLTKQTQKINSQAEELIALNEYDELGQLKSKKVGNTTTAPLQTVDYTYNIRGWLKTINNPSSLGNDLFGFRINYNTTETGTTGVNPLYNGNISETLWRTSNDNALRSYAYQYDPLNRIKKAVSSESGRYTLNSSIYDKNGNITYLSRNGQTDSDATIFGEMDKLYYAYSTYSNKLLKVDDRAATDIYGFKDDVTGSAIDNSNDYTYDVNGNLKTDTNKGITSSTSGFIYNHLNLPESVTITAEMGNGTGTISYVYDATGVKLKKIAPGNFVTEYAGNYIYEAGAFKFFNQPEGYVEKVGTAYKYVYQYKDHLGSIRLAYKNIGTPVSPSLRIEEQHHYYPFGLKQQYASSNPRSVNISNHQYGYNGKEEQNEKGIKWLDFGARNYDASIGRWMNVDPLAELDYSLSSYNYTMNNPILLSDPTGLSTHVKLNEDGEWEVVEGGDADDDDDNIYITALDEDGVRHNTGLTIGKSLTSHSFFDDDNNAVVGAIIDLESTDGQDFIDDEIIGDHPFIVNYMANGTGGGYYDFKERGIEDARKEGKTDIQHRYRGSVASNGKIGSARDFGNVAAGIVAGRFGLSWRASRLGFDTLETAQHSSLISVSIPGGGTSYIFNVNLTSEKAPTQKAQRIGWEIGIKLNQEDGKIDFFKEK